MTGTCCEIARVSSFGCVWSVYHSYDFVCIHASTFKLNSSVFSIIIMTLAITTSCCHCLASIAWLKAWVKAATLCALESVCLTSLEEHLMT